MNFIDNIYKLVNKLNSNKLILTKLVDNILMLVGLNRNTKIIDIGDIQLVYTHKTMPNSDKRNFYIRCYNQYNIPLNEKLFFDKYYNIAIKANLYISYGYESQSIYNKKVIVNINSRENVKYFTEPIFVMGIETNISAIFFCCDTYTKKISIHSGTFIPTIVV